MIWNNNHNTINNTSYFLLVVIKMFALNLRHTRYKLATTNHKYIVITNYNLIVLAQ